MQNLTVEELMGAIIYGQSDDWEKFRSQPGFEEALSQVQRSCDVKDALYRAAVEAMSLKMLQEKALQN